MKSIKERIVEYEAKYGPNIHARRAYNYSLRGGMWWKPWTWTFSKKKKKEEGYVEENKNKQRGTKHVHFEYG